jgi:hypothetical protein
MPLYFAYGSNMDRAAMRQRCPKSTPLGPARLARHRLVIGAQGYASVVHDPRRSVWGLLWDLALADVSALDRYEDVGNGLYGKAVQPVITDSGARRALIYLVADSRPGAARPGYIEGILGAARDIGLPPDYIRDLEGLVPGTAGKAAADERARAVRPTRAAPGAVLGKPWT